ncbi:hypothetical protein BDW62DRAFT_202384 [Aspergillus aurantiobrunneus]
MSSLVRRLLPRPVANTGSQLRDHQANERTFLSWTRMGLAFAAMGLAVGRLGLIEHFFSTQVVNGTAASKSPENKTETTTRIRTNPDLVASRLCQGISVWSFGYGLFRYLSVRRNLGKNQFVPAIWGPVLMTAGTLGVIGVLIEMDWKHPQATYRGQKTDN